MVQITINVSKDTCVGLANMCISELQEINKLEDALTQRGLCPERMDSRLFGNYRQELHDLIKQFSEAAGD